MLHGTSAAAQTTLRETSSKEHRSQEDGWRLKFKYLAEEAEPRVCRPWEIRRENRLCARQTHSDAGTEEGSFRRECNGDCGWKQRCVSNQNEATLFRPREPRWAQCFSRPRGGAKLSIRDENSESNLSGEMRWWGELQQMYRGLLDRVEKSRIYLWAWAYVWNPLLFSEHNICWNVRSEWSRHTRREIQWGFRSKTAPERAKLKSINPGQLLHAFYGLWRNIWLLQSRSVRYAKIALRVWKQNFFSVWHFQMVWVCLIVFCQ